MLCCVECVVKHVSCLVNVQVLGVPRRSAAMEKVKCGVCVRWTRIGEGRTRRLGLGDQRPENKPCVAHIGHRKTKSTCVMEMALSKSRKMTIVP